MTNTADGQGESRRDERGGRRWLWLLLLLLLLLGAWGAYWWFSQKDDGSFSLTFRGCDTEGRCGEFKLFAPGYDYRWSYGRTTLDPIQGSEPELLAAIGEDIAGAQGVIAAGLASREGGDIVNRRLSACRSKRLATLIDDVKADVGSEAETFRIALGRYSEDVIENDTSIERLVVLAFILEADPGINLDEALKDGLASSLPAALAQVLAPIRAQLDFTRYACWNEEFEVTPASDVRTTCFREPSPNAAAFCGAF